MKNLLDVKNKSSLEDVQNCSLEILDTFIDFCEKHNLTYYADSGTLLGAVRHKGFIPWDDDIDITMPRKDFNRLIEIADSEFKYPYRLLSFHNEKNALVIARFCKLDTARISKHNLNDICRDKDGHFTHKLGIVIDICPIDHIEDHKYEKQLDMLHGVVKFVNTFFMFRTVTHTEYNKELNFEDSQTAIRLLHKTLTRIDDANKNSNIVICSGWVGFKDYKIAYPASIYEKKLYVLHGHQNHAPTRRTPEDGTMLPRHPHDGQRLPLPLCRDGAHPAHPAQPQNLRRTTHHRHPAEGRFAAVQLQACATFRGAHRQ